MDRHNPAPPDRGNDQATGADNSEMDKSILPNPVALVTNWLDQHRSAFDEAIFAGDIDAAFLIVYADRVFTPALQRFEWEAVR